MRIALALVLAATCALPQTRRPAAPKPKPAAAKPAPRATERITSIAVRGSALYTSEELTPLTGLKVGAPFDRAALEAARVRMTDTGLFTNVTGEYKVRSQSGVATTSVDLTFEVSDFPQRYPLRFDRLGKPDADLQTLLREKVPLYRDPLPYAVTLLDQVKAALAPVTGPVTLRITGDTGADQFLLIHPQGKPPVVAEVRFKGGEVIPNDELVFAMRGTAVGIEYREALFRELLKLGAVPLYEARGRVRVQFTKIEVEQAKDVPGFLVTTTVEEGPSYTISDVKVSGVGDRLKRDLLRTANLKPGDLANSEEVKAAQSRMLAIVKRNGFIDATSAIERSINDEKREVEYTITFDSGELYTFGRLTLKGLDIISEPAVKKMWAGEPGKPFNPEYPEAFLASIKAQRMFDNLKETRATSTPNRDRHTVDVVLEFK